jgi:hypothetical protein
VPAPPSLASMARTEAIQATADAARAAAANQAPLSFSSTADAYEKFIAHVRQSRPLLASLLENGICVQIPGESTPECSDTDVLFVCFRPEDAYYRDQLQSRVYAEQMVTYIKEFFRRQARLKIDLRETGETLASKREREHNEKEQSARNLALNHPILTEARSLFGGEMGPIELTNANS